MEKRNSFFLGILFVLLGLLGFFGSLIIAYLDSIGYWTPGVMTDIFSALMAPRDREPQLISLVPLRLRLIHYFVAGLILLILGGGLLAIRRRIVPLVEEVTVTLCCPRHSCGNEWKESMAKTSLEFMGYPRVKSLSRRRCPKCGKFIRPQIIKVEGLEGEKKEAKKEKGKEDDKGGKA